MIWWRAAPDGGRLTIRWLPGYRRWEVRRERGADWFESRRLGLALSAATGDPTNAEWIRIVEKEIAGDGDDTPLETKR